LPCIVEKTDGGNGDDCHHEFFNWESKSAEKTIKAVPLNTLEICVNGEIRNLTTEDLPK
jgi:hypothetical protein